jgi:phospholipid transport system substrate-binding protein
VRLWLLAAALFCVLAGEPAAAEAQSPAQLLVETTSTQVLTELRAESAAISSNPALLDTIAQKAVLPHFDFERMSQRVLGQHWRKATPEQRGRFMAEFTTLLVRTYATAVFEYRESEVRFMPARELGDKIQRIRSLVDRRDGRAPLQVDYDVFERADGWKVMDVAINGISLVVSYRSGFNTDVAKLGMDGLIDQIAQHNAARAALQ